MNKPKFRVWDNVDHMSKPFTLNELQAGLIQFDSVCPVMQFTGLTDKNGVEIYEGDILEEDNQLFSVVFDSTWARFKLQHGKVIQNPEWNRGVKMSVIGNIHQNPELLEQNDE